MPPGQSKNASPPIPIPRANNRADVMRSFKKRALKIVAHSGMVNAIITARLAFIRKTPWAENMCQPVILKIATRHRGLSSLRASLSLKPFALASINIPIPLRTRQYVRKVQGGISLTEILIAGQARPQNMLSEISSTMPLRGSPLVCASETG